jgi:hypothetical protein
MRGAGGWGPIGGGAQMLVYGGNPDAVFSVSKRPNSALPKADLRGAPVTVVPQLLVACRDGWQVSGVSATMVAAATVS